MLLPLSIQGRRGILQTKCIVAGAVLLLAGSCRFLSLNFRLLYDIFSPQSTPLYQLFLASLIRLVLAVI